MVPNLIAGEGMWVNIGHVGMCLSTMWGKQILETLKLFIIKSHWDVWAIHK